MTEQHPPILPVILSGGTGTRLWPLSREGYPKQFWPLAADRPMLVETAARAEGPGFAPHGGLQRGASLPGGRTAARPGRAHRAGTEGRNSGPAIAAAALLAEESGPGTVMWIMAADSAIKDVPALHAALGQAAAAARAGRIVTFGMAPTAPETGYGYIEAGADLPGLPGARAIARFVEKPDAARAAEFVAGGRHLWNSGMFVATASVLLAELERHEPTMLAAVRQAVAGAKRDMDFVRLDAAAFARRRRSASTTR